MRYYIYVSPTKVEQLFAQIPQQQVKRLVTKLTVDLKIVKAEISARESQETLFSRLVVVERFLEEESVVGSVDQPQAYLSGSMSLHWITLDDERERRGEEPVVFFSGETSETVVGLAGSASNVLGESNPAAISAGSQTPRIIRALQNAVGDAPETHDSSYKLLNLTSRVAAVARHKGTQHQMTFLAKRLGEGRLSMEDGGREDSHTVLGTPLFVALDE